MPDAQWGEAIKAVCVLKPGQTLAAEALIEFVGGRIARYKKPKDVVFVAALPKTAAGGAFEGHQTRLGLKPFDPPPAAGG